MCGICGVLHAEPEAPVSAARIREMTASIAHRGPDDDGFYVEGPVGLGMRRLSIIDLESGRQPIANEDRTVVLVYNGEVYNYRSLRNELEAAGHSFRTRTDTEVVVHAYEDGGADGIGRLRGMFALALWDSARRSLLLAVDRFGIKPLYYAAGPEGIAFGSELKCILLSGASKRQIDPQALAQYFTFGYIPPPATIFADVRKLAPGSLLRWTPRDGAQVRQYWESPRDRLDQQRTIPETKAQLREALIDAVHSHLVSDVPVGAFLSGGIDSSALVALMSKSVDEPVRTFSIGFVDPRYSELPKARLIAHRYRTQHHELVVEPESVELLPRLVRHFDEPFADASALPTYHVSRLAREHVKVALAGDGGDELFLGYTLFRGLKVAHLAGVLPDAVRQRIATLAARTPRVGGATVGDRVELTLKRLADSILPPELAFKRKMSAPGLDVVRPMLSGDLDRELEPQDPFAIVDHWLARYDRMDGAPPLEKFVYTGFQTSLAGDMLVKVDRMSMANSLEVRVPFLDHVLAEYVATIPVERRMPGWRLKPLLRDTIADLLPASIRRQSKWGFAVPLATWFRGDVADYAREVLVSDQLRRRGLLDADAIEAMLARHLAGARNLGPVIWALLMFELWCQETLG
ncbi:MAG: asparagine synthase (glutamine-hydrolyzing) [Solirubrobacterales bacterium]|nr:asparagine synthase (glutamine-hydrolyzing) [Solirubrobacterales bacterium]